MKILHLISGGDTGGAKTHVLTLLTKLKSIGIDVELLCIMKGVFTDEAENAGLNVKIIPQKKRYDITVHKKIYNYINSSGADIVHCHGARANYIAMFIKHRVNVPMVTTLHSDYKLDFKDTFYKQMIFAPINAFALRRFSYIFTVTENFKNMLISRGFKSDRLYVVYNGIDFNFKPELLPREQFYSNFGIEYNPAVKYVGIAARFQAVKGVSNFLEAAKIICAERNDINFVIAGSGSEEQKFKEFIKNYSLEGKVFMIGHIKDINSFYNAVDVNTLTSFSESFPYALLEGARMKKATVSTAVGGIVEMISDGKTGFLVDAGDNNALADKIKMLADDDSLRSRIGNAFYDFAKKNFSAEKMAETHKYIYQKIVKGNF